MFSGTLQFEDAKVRRIVFPSSRKLTTFFNPISKVAYIFFFMSETDGWREIQVIISCWRNVRSGPISPPNNAY